ncbi:sugar phosphate isomerase/epimerase [Rhodocaloribacter litoris]|uniref:sugar phosphate isomerase/epimerase family protein n=1 Tax=Rhodocaloribacter litoris TaxID=2558931 RepID=UPI001424489C|nr:sugar phosphate isomerase/epimerase [Rhodocaloribacter litoris]QXD14039.1 sugar phosphate isomerase/epimerase [Rhodocaloribacter litoris]
MNRRHFLHASALALGGLALGGCAREDAAPGTADATATAGRRLDRIGLQLYTVRSLMQEDVPGTLARVAEIGYDEVEFAGYFDHSPADIRAMLEANGLAAPSTHTMLASVQGDRLEATVAQAAEVGHRYLVVAWLAPEERATLDHYRRHAETFNRAGEACRAAGLQFAYHNHDFEFMDLEGQRPYDLLLAETDPELVQMELDLYWITKAGFDPMTYFEQYPGRFPLCHVKDMAADGTMADVGAGTIDFAAIFAHAGHAGLRHYFVEHDNPADPLASISASYAHLSALTF